MTHKCIFCNTHGSEETIFKHLYFEHKDQIDALVISKFIINKDTSDIRNHKYYNYAHDEIIKMPHWLESLVSDWNETENPVCSLIHFVNLMQKFESCVHGNENVISYGGNFYRKMNYSEEFPNSDEKITGHTDRVI